MITDHCHHGKDIIPVGRRVCFVVGIIEMALILKAFLVIGKLVEKYKERELVRQQQYHTITSQRGKPSWVSSTNKHESSFRGAFDSIHYRLKRKFSDIDSQGNVRRRYTGASNSVRSSGISSSTAFTLDK